jgi:outer membrane protein assembly factor BamB
MKQILIIISILLIARIGLAALPPDSSQRNNLATKPTLLWKMKTNGPVVASPVAEAGKLFVGSLDSALYAFDITSGKVLWKLPTGGPVRSSVCLSAQRLYLLSTDGLLYRVEKQAGKVDGTFQASTGYVGDHQNDHYDYFTSTPVIADQMLYFGAGENIYALSTKDGLLRWTYNTGGLVHTRPVISNNCLYAGSFDGYLYALNAQTGNFLWKFRSAGIYSFPKGEFAGNPVAAGGMVFAGARDYNLYGVDVKTGRCNWMKQFPKGWAFPLTVYDSVLYAGTSEDHQLFAFDIRSGKELWKADAGFNIFGSMIIEKKTGIFGTLAGKVMAIDLVSGKFLWTVDLEGFTKNQKIYLKEDGKYRDDIGDVVRTPNDLLKMYERLGGIFGSPVVYEDKLVVAGYDGWVYCFTINPNK